MKGWPSQSGADPQADLRPLRRLAAVVVAAASAAVVVAASASVAACEPHDVIQIAATVKTAHTATTEKIRARAVGVSGDVLLVSWLVVVQGTPVVGL